MLIDITSPREQWRALGDGYRVGVRIVTLAVDDALRVPASAVFPLPDERQGRRRRRAAAMGVFIVQDGRARLRPVEVIARNSQDAWLRQGLQAGDAVIVYAPASVRDGVRVTARTR